MVGFTGMITKNWIPKSIDANWDFYFSFQTNNYTYSCSYSIYR